MSTFAHAMRRVIRRGGEAPAAEAAAVDGQAPVACRACRSARPWRSRPTTRCSRSCRPPAAWSRSTGSSSQSPAVDALREAGVSLVVPLVSGGELIGTLNLGPRLSDQQYSTDDKRLLDSLAAQAAPALQVAELVRRQASEAASRERIEQELRVAQLIQQNFLPRVLPDLPGWHLDAYYKPAREVGGDFYDFFDLPDGQVGVVVGDVTDKGVPAAMVMAAARSVLRATAAQVVAPGETLRARQRAALPRHPGQDVRHLPLRRDRPRVGPLPLRERRAQPARTRAPPTARSSCARPACRSACCPGCSYEEKEAWIAPGRGAAALLGRRHRGALDRRARCTARRGSREFVASGERADRRAARRASPASPATGWEQEDDITLVTLRRSAADAPRRAGARARPSASRASRATSARRWSAWPPRSRRSGSSRAGSSS